MRNIADVIEQFIISELFANDEDSINVKKKPACGKAFLRAQSDYLYPNNEIYSG